MIDRLEVSSRASKQDGWVRCERAGNGRAPRASWAVAPGPLALGAAVIALSTFTDSVRNLVGLATGAVSNLRAAASDLRVVPLSMRQARTRSPSRERYSDSCCDSVSGAFMKYSA